MLLTANSNKAMRKILVDADACPVKEIICEISDSYCIEAIFIASYAHYGSKESGVKWVYVDSHPQAVDLVIANSMKPGDIIVTQDFGLADMVIGKMGEAISPRGRIFSVADMDQLLAQRHLDSRIRRGGGRTKGPKAIGKEDKEAFKRNLIKLVTGTQQTF